MRLLREALDEIRDLRGTHASHRHLHGRLMALLLVSLAAYLFASLLAWLFLPDKDLAGWRAFVWTASTMLTGGSALNTESAGGHILGVILEIWAVTAIAALAGSFGAFFHRRGLERDPLGSKFSL
jgi:hypothetical protein